MLVICYEIFCHDQQKIGGGQFLDFMGRHRAHGGPPVPPPPPPTSENPERCQDKTEESLFLKQELKFFFQIYQGQA